MRFHNAAGLVNELILAQDEHLQHKVPATTLERRPIVLDELGFIPLSRSGTHVVSQFCSALCERVAVIVTRNRRFTASTQVFCDERLATALLNRLAHSEHILE